MCCNGGIRHYLLAPRTDRERGLRSPAAVGQGYICLSGCVVSTIPVVCVGVGVGIGARMAVLGGHLGSQCVVETALEVLGHLVLWEC